MPTTTTTSAIIMKAPPYSSDNIESHMKEFFKRQIGLTMQYLVNTLHSVHGEETEFKITITVEATKKE